jgi:MraZ protein
MALFIDTFVNKIDAKGRISVPATFRVALGSQSFHGIVALPSLAYRAIQCAGMDWMEQLGRQVNQADFLSDQQDELTAVRFGDTKQLAFDGEGRVVLPAALTSHANLDGFAAFVGRGPFFEIWEPKALESYKAEARQRVLEKTRAARQRGDER